MIPILGMKKLRPGVVLISPRSHSQEKVSLGAWRWSSSVFLPLRVLGPLPSHFLKERVLVREEERRSQLHLVFSSFSAKHLSAFHAPRTSGNISKAGEEGPQTRALQRGKGWLTRLTSITRLTHRRTAESHPSRPAPSTHLPDLLPERGPPLVLTGARPAGGRERGRHGPCHGPRGCSLPLDRGLGSSCRLG